MDAKLTMDSFAEELYETYCEAVGGKSFDGSPLPSWESFKKDPEKAKQVRGWMAVAWKARHTLTVKISSSLMDGLGTFPD
jgi:hypothetical protein